MEKRTKIVIKSISLITLFVLLPFLNAQAAEINNPINEYDSIYRYNALENKFSFINIKNNEDNLAEKLPADSVSPDNNSKELQDVIEKQNSSTEESESAMDAIENRNGFKTFLIGNNLEILKSQVVQMQDQISILEVLSLKSQDNINKIQIDKQMKSLKEEQKKVENFILQQNNKFSLFGWLVALL